MHDVQIISAIERILCETAKHMIDGTCIGTDMAIYTYVIDVLAPENVSIIHQSINFETEIGKDREHLSKLLNIATDTHP